MEQTAAVSGTPGGGERTARKAATALKVVVAVDASESLHALSWALDNIVRCHPDATLVVVHFAYPVAAHAVVYAPSAAAESMHTVAQEENSRRIVGRALDICKERQVGATGAVVEGDAKEAIRQAVERMQAGLLVLGTTKRAFLGSVSDYLIHHACCPVLVVRPRPTK